MIDDESIKFITFPLSAQEITNIIMNNLEKKTRFNNLATKRTNEIMNRLRILSNCSDRRTYTYTDEEVEKIFKAIDEQVKIVKAKFKSPRRGFKL